MAGSYEALCQGGFGPRFVLPTVVSLEQVDQAGYDDQPETAGGNVPDQQRSHARVLRDIVGGFPQGLAGQTPATRDGLGSTRTRLVAPRTQPVRPATSSSRSVPSSR
jgi:hypothetical protein